MPPRIGHNRSVPRDDHDASLHLINPLRNPCGGSERRTIDMARLLRARHGDVTVWAARDASPGLVAEARAQVINPVLGRFPRHGTMVFVGTYFSVGRWIALASPRRVLVIFNTDQPHWLRDNLARIAASGCSAEVVYTSVGLRTRHRGVGPVLESTIDLTRFAFQDPRDAPSRVFTVGRLSRDDVTKHHAEDPALYRRLAAAGLRVRLMGATCIARELDGVPGIEILPEGAMSAQTFLRGLDAFVYRTSNTWYEAFGRVVFEAMAAGVPVACTAAGGFSHYLTSGANALIAQSTDELAGAVIALRDDAAFAARIARRARDDVEAIQRNADLRLIALMVDDSPRAGHAPAHVGAAAAASPASRGVSTVDSVAPKHALPPGD
jgi:glycosyltransferase involved in cell wall biosynthesis